MPRKTADKLPRMHNPKAWTVTVTLKVSSEEAEQLEMKALAYAEGNRSRYARTALLNYKPKKGDF